MGVSLLYRCSTESVSGGSGSTPATVAGDFARIGGFRPGKTGGMAAFRLHRVVPQCRECSGAVRLCAAILETVVEIHLFPDKAGASVVCVITENIGGGLEVFASIETVTEIRCGKILIEQPGGNLSGEPRATGEAAKETRHLCIVGEQSRRNLSGKFCATLKTAADSFRVGIVIEQPGGNRCQSHTIGETVLEIRSHVEKRSVERQQLLR